MADYPGTLPAWNSPEGVALREAYNRCVVDGPAGPLLRVWAIETIPLAGLAGRITKKGNVEVYYPLSSNEGRNSGWIVAEEFADDVALIFGFAAELAERRAAASREAQARKAVFCG